MAAALVLSIVAVVVGVLVQVADLGRNGLARVRPLSLGDGASAVLCGLGVALVVYPPARIVLLAEGELMALPPVAFAAFCGISVAAVGMIQRRHSAISHDGE